MRTEYQPYDTIEMNNRTFDDYQIEIKGTNYNVWVCRETQTLSISIPGYLIKKEEESIKKLDEKIEKLEEELKELKSEYDVLHKQIF